MDNIGECYYEDDEDPCEKLMNKKTKDIILYEWKKHHYNVSITRTIKKDSQQRARDLMCFELLLI